MPTLYLLSGGAAKGLVSQLQARFLAQTGFGIDGQYDAVGKMREQLLAGAPCDLIILTDGLIAQLTSSGHLLAGSARPLGLVKTGIAVKDGAALPPLAMNRRSRLLARTPMSKMFCRAAAATSS